MIWEIDRNAPGLDYVCQNLLKLKILYIQLKKIFFEYTINQ